MLLLHRIQGNHCFFLYVSVSVLYCSTLRQITYHTRYYVLLYRIHTVRQSLNRSKTHGRTGEKVLGKQRAKGTGATGKKGTGSKVQVSQGPGWSLGKSCGLGEGWGLSARERMKKEGSREGEGRRRRQGKTKGSGPNLLISPTVPQYVPTIFLK
jgi:hypothetical protein